MSKPAPLSLDDRLALLDRAQAMALREAAQSRPQEVIAQLLEDCHRQGLEVPRHCVEKAVADFLAQPEDHWPTVTERRAQLLIKVVGVIGAVLLGLVVLRLAIPLFERLLAPMM